MMAERVDGRSPPVRAGAARSAAETSERSEDNPTRSASPSVKSPSLRSVYFCLGLRN